MPAERARFSRTALLFAGFAAGALMRIVAGRRQAATVATLRRSLADTQLLFTQQQTTREQTLARVEERLDAHEERLKDAPSTVQIVSALDEVLSKTFRPLNQRLSAQAVSIDLLKTTVEQTDMLLERVLESLDSLRQVPGMEQRSGPSNT